MGKVKGYSISVVSVAALTVFLLAAASASGQSGAARAPRTGDGRPNLNGIWQAMNEANYDLEDEVFCYYL